MNPMWMRGACGAEGLTAAAAGGAGRKTGRGADFNGASAARSGIRERLGAVARKPMQPVI